VGRPSLARARRRQIIDATVQSMAMHGVGGTTLERVADLAEMSRGHVRHFAGNRDELLIDAARVFFFGDAALDQADLVVLAREAPLVSPDTDIDGALDYLFGEFAEPGNENAAAFAFVDAGRTLRAIHDIVLEAYRTIERSLATILRRAHPTLSAVSADRLAYALFALASGNSYVNDLDPSPHRIRGARESAQAMIRALTLGPR